MYRFRFCIHLKIYQYCIPSWREYWLHPGSYLRLVNSFLLSITSITFFILYHLHMFTIKVLFSTIANLNISCVVLATDLGNLQVVRVWTGRKNRFGFRHIHQPNLPLVGGSNLDLYPSTGQYRRVWQDSLGPISGCAFQVDVFILEFSYPTVDRKILHMVHHCSFWMAWPPL